MPGSFTQASSTPNEFDGVTKRLQATHERPAPFSTTTTLDLLSASTPQPAWVPQSAQPAKLTKKTLLPQNSDITHPIAATIPNGPRGVEFVGPSDPLVALKKSAAAVHKAQQMRKDAERGHRWYAPLQDADETAHSTSHKSTGFLSKIRKNREAARITHKDAGILLKKLMKEYPDLRVNPVYRSDLGKLNDFERKIQGLRKKQDNDALGVDCDSVSIVQVVEEKANVPQPAEIGEPSAIPTEDSSQATDRTNIIAEDASLLSDESSINGQVSENHDTDEGTQQSQPINPTETDGSDASALSDGHGIDVQASENHSMEELEQRSGSPSPTNVDGHDGIAEIPEASSSIGDDETTVSERGHSATAGSSDPQDIGGHEPRLESVVPSVRAQGQGEEVQSPTEPSDLGDEMEGVEPFNISNLQQTEVDAARLRAAVASAPGLRPRDVFRVASQTNSLPGFTCAYNWNVSQHLPGNVSGHATTSHTSGQSYNLPDEIVDKAGEAMDTSPDPGAGSEPANLLNNPAHDPTANSDQAYFIALPNGDTGAHSLTNDLQLHEPVICSTEYCDRDLRADEYSGGIVSYQHGFCASCYDWEVKVGRLPSPDESLNSATTATMDLQAVQLDHSALPKRERTETLDGDANSELQSNDYNNDTLTVKRSKADEVIPGLDQAAEHSRDNSEINMNEPIVHPELESDQPLLLAELPPDQMHPSEDFEPLLPLSRAAAGHLILNWTKASDSYVEFLTEKERQSEDGSFAITLANKTVKQEIDSIYWRMTQACDYGTDYGKSWLVEKVPKGIVLKMKKTHEDTLSDLQELARYYGTKNRTLIAIVTAYENFIEFTRNCRDFKGSDTNRRGTRN